jgi:DNA invertase Pin-like site-specific DNA recombinase
VLTLQDFSDLGVEFISIRDQLDLTTASGRLMLHLVSAFAEFERELIVERTLLGLDHAKANGKVLGRPKVYSDSKILTLRSQGMSYREIQRTLGCSSGVINRAISLASKSVPDEAITSALKTRLPHE